MRWRRHREPSRTVIGQEMAAAVVAESIHQQTVPGPSPLDGVHYEVSDDLTLLRFEEVESDVQLRAFVKEYATASDTQRAETRQALTMDDIYTLLAFARRSAVMALRENNEAP